MTSIVHAQERSNKNLDIKFRWKNEMCVKQLGSVLLGVSSGSKLFADDT